MNTSLIEQKREQAEWAQSAQIRRLEPDWAESEWFQVWLELARLPHKSPAVELALEPPSSFSIAEETL